MCQEDTLAMFDSNVTTKTYLACDASGNGIGTVLEQGVIGKSPLERRPILYCLSSFRDYGKNYSISEKEALACVSSMNKFRFYLLGREFLLRTDPRALEILLAQTGSKRVDGTYRKIET